MTPTPQSVPWRENVLFRDVDPPVLDALERFVRPARFAAGEPIVHEGDPADVFYLLTEGEAAVEHAGVGFDRTLPGGEIGLMGVLGRTTRGATVLATKPSVAAALGTGALDMLGADHPIALQRMLANHLAVAAERGRRSSTLATENIRARLVEAEQRALFSRVFGFIMVFLFLYNTGLGGLKQLIVLGGNSTWVTSAMLVLLTLTLGFLLWRQPFPMSTYGLTLAGWRNDLRDAVLWSVAFLLGCFALKVLAIATIPAFAGIPLVSVSRSLVPVLVYTATVPAQEFVFRGAIQGSLHQFLTGPNAVWSAILLGDAMFAMSHLHLSPAWALMVLAPGILWGWMFARHRSLLGVTVSHVLIGVGFTVFVFPGKS